jgi:hypothetical protein
METPNERRNFDRRVAVHRTRRLGPADRNGHHGTPRRAPGNGYFETGLMSREAYRL